MEGADLWAMLNPRSPNIIVAARGYGSLSVNDLRFMLRDLSRGPMLMGMVFDTGDTGSLRDLELYLWCRIQERAAAAGWQYHKNATEEPTKPFDRKLARLILIEIAQDQAGKVSKPCLTCGGIGFTVQATQPIICDGCHGIRSAKLTQQDRANYCGCTLRNWQQSWTHRYFVMNEMAVDWLSEARNHLKRGVNKFFNVA